MLHGVVAAAVGIPSRPCDRADPNQRARGGTDVEQASVKSGSRTSFSGVGYEATPPILLGTQYKRRASTAEIYSQSYHRSYVLT